MTLTVLSKKVPILLVYSHNVFLLIEEDFMTFLKKTGSVVCPSCGKLVGVQDQECWNCGRRNPGIWGFAPLLRKLGYDLGFTSIVTWGCAALYVITLLYDPRGIGMSGLDILSPSNQSVFIFGASGAIPIFGYGRWWTVLSAAWLHGSFLHILFNMLWIRQLAPATAELYGASRSIVIYTISSIAGFLLSSLAGFIFAGSSLSFLRGAGLTLGASAPIFGLLGALVVYGRRGGSSHISSHISSQAMTYAAVLFVFGFVISNVDNYAHLGGFVGGFAAAYALNPMRPERITHLIVALICLALIALSILASFLLALLA
jgi:rhomboid protease GluP